MRMERIVMKLAGGILVALLFLISSSHSSPINRQAGINENVYITVQNDTYGNEQRVCSIESMTYEDGESIPTSSPCEHCICRPPGFACTIISCEYRPGCKAMKRSNQCCPEYQCECEKDGKIYQNGEKILDENNPCEICYCQGGDVVCAVIDCYWRNDCQPRYIENRCCPLYDHCPPPSDIGPIRPTQRPLITSPTTVAPSILWFNLSSAVYSTKPTTEKPIHFQTSTQLVPVPDVPMDHALMPPQQENVISQKVPQEEEHGYARPVQSQSQSEENKFPQSIESGIIQSQPQHPELVSSVESIESGEPASPPQILEFPPSPKPEVVPSHVPVLADPAPSQEPQPSQVPEAEHQVTPEAVVPEEPVQQEVAPSLVEVEVVNKIHDQGQGQPEQVVVAKEPVPVQPVQPQEAVPVEPVNSHDVQVHVEDVPPSGQQELGLSPPFQLPERPQVQVQDVEVVEAQAPIEAVPTDPAVVVPEVVVQDVVPSEVVAPQEQHDEQTAAPMVVPEVEIPNEIVPSVEQAQDASGEPVQVTSDVASSHVVPEEIAPTSVHSQGEDSSNILEIPPAVLESSEPPPAITQEHGHGQGGAATDSLNQDAGFITSLSTETVVVAATSEEVLPSTTIIHSKPSLIVIGAVPFDQTEVEVAVPNAPEVSSDVASVTEEPVQHETPAPDTIVEPVVVTESPVVLNDHVEGHMGDHHHEHIDHVHVTPENVVTSEEQTVKPTVADPVVLNDHVEGHVGDHHHEHVDHVHVTPETVVTSEEATVKPTVADESEIVADVNQIQFDEQPSPPLQSVAVSENSQEISETPAPVVVQSQVMVQPEPPVEADQHDEVVSTVSPPVVPIANESPVVMVEVDSLFPGGVQSDEPVHSESADNQNVNELQAEVQSQQLSDVEKAKEPEPVEQPIEKFTESKEDVKPSVATPDLLVVVSDAGEPVPSIILEPPIFDFYGNHIHAQSPESVPQSTQEGSKISEFLQPPKEDELIFEPVILSHVKPSSQVDQSVEKLSDEPSIVQQLPHEPEEQLWALPPISADDVSQNDESVEVQPSPGVVPTSTEAPTSAPSVNDDNSAVEDKSEEVVRPSHIVDSAHHHHEVLQDSVFSEEIVDPTVVPSVAENVKTDKVPVPEVVQDATEVNAEAPSTQKPSQHQQEPEVADPIILSDDSSPVFDEKPADTHTTLQPVIEVSHAQPENIYADEVVSTEVPVAVTTDSNKYRLDLSIFESDDSKATQSPTTLPPPVHSGGAAGSGDNELVFDEVVHLADSVVGTTPENVDKGRADETTTQGGKFRADDETTTFSSVDKSRADETTTFGEPEKSRSHDFTTTNEPEGDDESQFSTTADDAEKSRSDDEIPSTTTSDDDDVDESTTSSYQDKSRAEEIQSTTYGGVQHDEGQESTTYRNEDKSRGNIEAQETTVRDAIYERKDTDESTAGQSETTEHIVVHDEPIVETTVYEDQSDDATTEGIHLKNGAISTKEKNDTTHPPVEVEETTQRDAIHESDDLDDTVIIDREEPVPKFRMPSEMVNKVEPISDDLEQPAPQGKQTVQQEADNEVADAEETWFWRTFNRVRTMPLFLPAAPSARRPRRSVQEETEHYIRGKKVTSSKNKKDSSTDSKKGWAFPRFLLW